MAECVEYASGFVVARSFLRKDHGWTKEAATEAAELFESVYNIGHTDGYEEGYEEGTKLE